MAANETAMTLGENSFRVQEVKHTPGMIYQLIGQAIGKIGAIGKNQTNGQQGFKYRGVDQVYNALNPVMAELGIFFCPEVLDMKRDERTSKSGSIIAYTILHMRYTVFAPDGSSISLTVVGEGMDSGDKGCNKAMSVAYKYAMFQLFCIPTEEMIDPDGECFTDVQPKGTAKPAAAPAQPAAAAKPAAVAKPTAEPKAAKPAAKAQVTTQATIPAEQPGETAESFRKNVWAQFVKDFNDPKGEKLAQFRANLLNKGLIPNKSLKQMDLHEIRNFFTLVYEMYGNQKVSA